MSYAQWNSGSSMIVQNLAYLRLQLCLATDVQCKSSVRENDLEGGAAGLHSFPQVKAFVIFAKATNPTMLINT